MVSSQGSGPGGPDSSEASTSTLLSFLFALEVMAVYFGKQTDPFYKSVAWRRLRARVLERDHHQCIDCLALKNAGVRIRVNRATVVHHIEPRELRPDLAMDENNLISLCEACHNKRHPEKGGHPGSAKQGPPRGVRIIKV